MKIRCDFVSNSSSSSFVFYGIFVSNPDEEKFKSDWDYVESLNLSYNDFKYEIGDWGDDCIAIGVSIEKQKDDETLGAFKERIAKMISEKLGREIKKTDIELIKGVNADGCVSFGD